MVLFPVLLNKRPILFTGFVACLVGVLTACANSPTGQSLERSLAVDPKLEDNASILGSQTNEQISSAQLPEDFPTVIPRYPDAQLQNVEPLTGSDAQGQRTIWSSTDPSNDIQAFYRRAFESGSWQVISAPNQDGMNSFIVRRNDLKVRVSIPTDTTLNDAEETPTETETNPNSTTFEIQYIRSNTETAAAPSDALESSETATENTESVDSASGKDQNFTDFDNVPPGLRQYVEDLAALGVLTPDSSSANNKSEDSGTQFTANKIITRRQYARWLIETNNRIYENSPGKQIRLASETTQPAFQDVPASDPDFGAIQGLAEAGLIPSPLSGNSTEVLFRPDAPLTRENLVLWKVPLDIRQGLPQASLDAVQQTWGFQDAGKIDPKALRAVLADFQNGEQSIIRRVFGYTTLFQPQKPVTQAEAAAALWYFGSQGEGISASEVLQQSN
ncbi:S-layer domain protein [Coleofasciculus chthonoplastes PCC 7420]|uniref:S-layer domain protein n=1 Tax=Coleofasciculus chthonoplastes PCC 7420 TaxID=118168 RepID=B4W1T0_9CYAN|nr:S-layer homology domain-containing protein [Coleofasciculus chthonoplastes]EDX71884.1 S-layer domain protein [Coleofasciculus chthonoplastes PCC 7420]